jgi:hypothetical protein
MSNTPTVDDQYILFSTQQTIQCAQKKLGRVPKECKQIIKCEDLVYCVLIIENNIATSHPHLSCIKIWDLNGILVKSIDLGMNEIWELVKAGDDLIICASSDNKCVQIVNWKTETIENTIYHSAGLAVGGHNTMICFGLQNQFLIGKCHIFNAFSKNNKLD